MSEKKERQFEDEINDVKEIIQKLSNPEATLSQSVKLYKDGIEKIKSATKKLESAKLEISEYESK